MARNLPKFSRRGFLRSSLLAVGGAVVGSTTFLHRYNEAEQLVVERLELPVADLHPGLDGLTIVQLSDIHLEPYTQPPFVQRAVELANSLQPDLTVLTGDYVWHDVEAMFALAPVIAGLNARHGVFAVLGNHDIWTDVRVIRRGLVQAGIPLLVNEGLVLHHNGGQLYLAGMDDGWSGKPDPAAALAGAPPGVPVILLLHEPDLADRYSRDPRIALQLAGHSHGGQVRSRRGAFLLPYLGRKYDMGLFRVNDMWLYTNRGLGATSIPYRYNCTPEVTHLTLTRA